MYKKIRIGYFADGIWSHKAFLKIIQNSRLEIAFITPRFDTQDKTLFSLAQTYNIPYIKTNNINSLDFIHRIKNYNCDIFISMSFNQIFKEPLISLPPLKTINCHAGKLPKYRGRNILNWVLINDEKEFGITVHYVDCGIDTGDIILQRTFPIHEDDDYTSLLSIAHTQCANILYDALMMFLQNNVHPKPQDHSQAFYCPMRIKGDEMINWNQGSREIFNFIRALNAPNLGAKSYIKDSEITLYQAKFIPNAPKYIATTGVIVGMQKNMPIIKTLDSTLKITSYKYNGILKIGDRLENQG
ncbi:methionyl-tRNA formyltransferase [Helicobacter cholecystus]|uniref:methionyl-tRNA formyltransferase n=1 Tax=Helicobacter cholecystus TaxID=45498 RepID=UPI002738E9D7|nr:methionyl-tRNA formyltransferase [Helicobacter cholecystus]